MQQTKNLGPTAFRFGGKATKPSYIPNYVNLDPSEPPSNHKFREVDKKKWIGGDLKLC